MAIFDCDHIPTRSFFTIYYGLKVSKKTKKNGIGTNTTPLFSPPDPFERNLGNFPRNTFEILKARFLWIVSKDGNDTWNAAFSVALVLYYVVVL